MGAVFLKLVNMSISSIWIVGIVLILRLVLKRAPKWLHCVLWAMVAVRLICPISFESPVSLLPSSEVIPSEVIAAGDIQIHTGFDAVDNQINSGVLESYMEGVTVPTGNTHRVMTILAWIWLSGAALMSAYAVITYTRLKRSVAASVETAPNVLVCDYIASPFILGILNPRIYLPSAMPEQAVSSVLAHEKAHIQRRDHWWKPLGYLLLTVHWFNPVIWTAYVLLCRDIELACDEKVIGDMDAAGKRQYSEALLSCSLPRHLIAACPLAFGEVGVKERVKSVLNYKKPAFWIVFAAVVACIVVAVCFLTDPTAVTLKKQFGVPDANGIIMTAGDTSAAFLKKEEVKKVEAFLRDARIDPLPISQDRSENRAKDYCIVFSDGPRETIFWFDNDFTDVWVDDGVKPSLSYRMEDPTQACAFFETMLGIDIPEPVSGGPDENGQYFFMATVLRTMDKSVLVEPLEGSRERGSSDKIWVSLIFESEEPVPEIRVGDRIKVRYNSMIQETYPAQVNWVYGIEVIERVLTDDVIDEIKFQVGSEEVILFDYCRLGKLSVLGCKYDEKHGIVYFVSNESVTVVNQESLDDNGNDSGFLYDESWLAYGILPVIVKDPSIYSVYVADSFREEGETREYRGYAIYNFPGLVVVPYDENSKVIYCLGEDGSHQIIMDHTQN